MPLPHPCWLSSFLTRQEVCYLRRLAGPASLEDWRCSCLCSELIPSVTERSALFVKELSFPQTAPTDDAFFNRTGLERVTIAGPELELSLGWSADSGRWTPLQKQERRRRVGEGFARGLSDA